MINYKIIELTGYENNSSLYLVSLSLNGSKVSMFHHFNQSGNHSVVYPAIKTIWKRLKHRQLNNMPITTLI